MSSCELTAGVGLRQGQAALPWSPIGVRVTAITHSNIQPIAPANRGRATVSAHGTVDTMNIAAAVPDAMIPRRLPERAASNRPSATARPKLRPRHQIRERPVRGDHDSRVDAFGARATDALNRQVLEGTQQFGLSREREI